MLFEKHSAHLSYLVLLSQACPAVMDQVHLNGEGRVSEAGDGLFSTPPTWLDDMFLGPVQGLNAVVWKTG